MKNEDKARAKRYKDNYNLTIAEYDIVDDYQSHVCWFCGKPQPPVKGVPRRLAVEHSHTSGLVRSLCCSLCNRMLGKIENGLKRAGWQISMLRKVSAYLLYPSTLPVTMALGHEVIGWKGRCGTKRHKAEIRRTARSRKKCVGNL
jgi:hypothetical protein